MKKWFWALIQIHIYTTSKSHFERLDLALKSFVFYAAMDGTQKFSCNRLCRLRYKTKGTHIGSEGRQAPAREEERVRE